MKLITGIRAAAACLLLLACLTMLVACDNGGNNSTPTAEPTATPAPTAAPTPAPVVTPAPLPTGTPEPAYETEGTFRSDTGAWLNLVVRWKLQKDGEKTVIHLNAYAESYSLMCSGADDVEFIIGGTSVKDSSGVINIADNSLNETLIGTADIEVERGKTADVFVTWKYNGTYGSPNGVKSLDTIEANAEIYIP